jgi:hypothetical protein
MATYVYVDALNFYYGALEGTPYKWLDYEAIARILVPYDQIGKIRYFTANVKPRGPGDKAHERQAAYLRALDSNPLVDIVRGYFRQWRALDEKRNRPRDLFRPDLRPRFLITIMLTEAKRRRTKHHTLARVIVPEEKGSDVSLGSYLVYDALKHHFDKALVLSNDSDLKDAVKLAVSEGLPVGIVNPHKVPTSAALKREATFEIPFRHEVLARCQLPNVVVGRNGKQVRKPVEW